MQLARDVGSTTGRAICWRTRRCSRRRSKSAIWRIDPLHMQCLFKPQPAAEKPEQHHGSAADVSHPDGVDEDNDEEEQDGEEDEGEEDEDLAIGADRRDNAELLAVQRLLARLEAEADSQASCPRQASAQATSAFGRRLSPMREYQLVSRRVSPAT